MIIQASVYQQMNDFVQNGNASYAQVLPWFWCLIQNIRIKTENRKEYSSGIFDRLYQNTIKWIEKEPLNSNINLRKSNQCSYCGVPLTDKNGVGDHIVGRELDQVAFIVPCCNIYCNPSKGNRDLVEWVVKKNKPFETIRIEVWSIYIRGKYKLMKQTGRLDELVTKEFHQIFLEMWKAGK